MLITNVRGVVVGGMIKPIEPLEMPEGSAVEVDIRTVPQEGGLTRQEIATDLIEALKKAAFRSGEPKFCREDLYDRD